MFYSIEELFMSDTSSNSATHTQVKTIEQSSNKYLAEAVGHRGELSELQR